MHHTGQHNLDLIRSCKTGNARAQLEIYNRYHHAMYNTAHRIVKSDVDAEDIMQEAFLTAFTKLNTLKDLEMFGGWLKKIVINRSLSYYKSKMKQNEIPLDQVLYKVENEEEFNVEEDYTGVKVGRILKTMDQLKDNYRVILTLHLIEGYDHEEIGQVMNISNANCRTMISRAKESLRNKMQVGITKK